MLQWNVSSTYLSATQRGDSCGRQDFVMTRRRRSCPATVWSHYSLHPTNECTTGNFHSPIQTCDTAMTFLFVWGHRVWMFLLTYSMTNNAAHITMQSQMKLSTGEMMPSWNDSILLWQKQLTHLMYLTSKCISLQQCMCYSAQYKL